MTEEHISWDPVQSYLHRVPVLPAPAAGTDDWAGLDDSDPGKAYALMVAGSRWVLEVDLAQRDLRREAMKSAAVEVSTALPWSRIAREIRERDDFYRTHPHLKRRSA